MIKKLDHFVGNHWVFGTGQGVILKDPILGSELVCVDSTGINYSEAFSYARTVGGHHLKVLNYQSWALLLKEISQVLTSIKDKFYDIALQNSGTVKNDSIIEE